MHFSVTASVGRVDTSQLRLQWIRVTYSCRSHSCFRRRLPSEMEEEGEWHDSLSAVDALLNECVSAIR